VGLALAVAQTALACGVERSALMTPQDAAALLSVTGATCIAANGAQGAIRCQWKFPLRTQDAMTTYQTMHQQFGACLPFERDTGVNHPDAYHGVTYTNDHHRFMLTYKDKSALGWTFVTFRVFNAP